MNDMTKSKDRTKEEKKTEGKRGNAREKEIRIRGIKTTGYL